MSEKKPNSLLNGRFLKCPRCEQESDLLAFIPLAEIPKYAAFTQPIHKCPKCKWVFALSIAYESFASGGWKVQDA